MGGGVSNEEYERLGGSIGVLERGWVILGWMVVSWCVLYLVGVEWLNGVVEWGGEGVVCDCQRRGVKWMNLKVRRRDEYWVLCMECEEGGVDWRRRRGGKWMMDLIRMHWWILVEGNGTVGEAFVFWCCFCLVGIAYGWMELRGWGLKRIDDEGVFASESRYEERMKR